jgi:hypothetical protein
MKSISCYIYFTAALLLYVTSVKASISELDRYTFNNELSEELYDLVKCEEFVIPKEKFLFEEDIQGEVYDRFILSAVNSFSDARKLKDLANSGDAKAQFELSIRYSNDLNEFFDVDHDLAKDWLSRAKKNGYFWAKIRNFNIYELSRLAHDENPTLSDERLGAYHYMMYRFKDFMENREHSRDKVISPKDNNGRPYGRSLSGGTHFKEYMPNELSKRYDTDINGKYIGNSVSYDLDSYDIEVPKGKIDTYEFDNGVITKTTRIWGTPSYREPIITRHVLKDYSPSNHENDEDLLRFINSDRINNISKAANYSPRYYAYEYAKSVLNKDASAAENNEAIKHLEMGAAAGDARCVFELGKIYNTDVFTDRDLKIAYAYYNQFLCMIGNSKQKYFAYRSHYNKKIKTDAFQGDYKEIISQNDFQKFIGLDSNTYESNALSERCNFLYKYIINRFNYYRYNVYKPIIGSLRINDPLDVVFVSNFLKVYINGLKAYETSLTQLDELVKQFKIDLINVGFSEENPTFAQVTTQFESTIKNSTVWKELEAKRLNEERLLAEQKEKERLEAKRLKEERLLEEEKRKERLAGWSPYERMMEEQKERERLEAERKKDLGFVIGRRLAPLLIIIFFLYKWLRERAKKSGSIEIPKEYFVKAEIEFSSDDRNKEALLKAEVLTSGNESLTKLKYIELRSAELYKEENKSAHQ